MNKENIIIKVSKDDNPEGQKVRQDALNIRREVFKNQGRNEDLIFDTFDDDKETSFLTCYIKNEDDDLKPIGSIRSFIEKHNDKLVGRSSKLSVLPEYRNNGSANIKGIADNLLQAAENIIIEKVDKPELLHIKGISSAIKFYKRFGYSGEDKLFIIPGDSKFSGTPLFKQTPSEVNKLDFKVEKCLPELQKELEEERENI